jgi:cytochrome P450
MSDLKDGAVMADMAEVQEWMGKMLEVHSLAFTEPDELAARASAAPQEMYLDRVGRCPVKQVGDGVFRLLRMDDILYVNKHPDVLQGSRYLGSTTPSIPLGLDGPEHRKYRKLMDPVFTAKRIEHLAPRVRTFATELIDAFIERGSVDAYTEFTEPLPSTIFLSIMGLPMDELRQFIDYKNRVLAQDPHESHTEDRVAQQLAAITWLQDYFNASLDERMREATPRDDMIGWLMTAEVDGHQLTREETLNILGLLMIAGLDTVTGSLSCFLSHLATHPDLRRQLVADPSLVRSTVEELMRFESPVTDGSRVATTELTLPSGAVIPAGSWMAISWSAANLDPSTFEDPLEVKLDRNPNPHIGFASGYHRCLGSNLARMELEIALSVWHERIPEYTLAPGTELEYWGNPRAPHHLPLVFG